MLQRALRGMRVFETFDPAGVYDYWARLSGGMQVEITKDQFIPALSFGPQQVPIEYSQFAWLRFRQFDNQFGDDDVTLRQQVGRPYR